MLGRVGLTAKHGCAGSRPLAFLGISTLLVALASCGSSGASTVTKGGTTTSPSATSAVAVSPSNSSSSSSSCQPSGGATPSEATSTPTPATSTATEATTTLSHPEYPFTFSYPASWDDRTGSITVTAAPLLDAQTLAAVGLQPTDTVAFVQLVAGSLNPALSVYKFTLTSGDLALEAFYKRQEARLSLQSTTQIGQTAISGCVGGQAMEGLELTTKSGDAFQKSWFVVRNRDVYHIQFVATSAADAGILAAILATWKWSS
jgi:hypothetical protein